MESYLSSRKLWSLKEEGVKEIEYKDIDKMKK